MITKETLKTVSEDAVQVAVIENVGTYLASHL